MSRQTAIILALSLFAASAAATFSMSSIIKQAEVIKVNAVTAATNSAITVSTTIRGFAANDPYQIKSLSVPKASFMTHVKGGIGSLAKENAWYAAWALSVGAAGWAINELTQQMEYHPVLQVGNAFPVGTVFSSCILIGDGGSTIITRTNSNMTNCMAATGSFVNFKIVGSFSSQGSFYQAPITYCFASQPTVCWPTGYLRVYSPVAPVPIISPAEPVSDNSLYDSLTAFMMSDPEKAAQAFMVPGAYPYPYPNLMPATVPYIPGVSQLNQDLLNLYSQGLLQSTNPNASNYVSPEKYAEISSLAAQLAQGASPQGQVDEANQKLLQPLTQAQLEETLKKRDIESKKEADEISAIDKKPVTDAYKDSKLKDEYDKLKERVTDESKLPQLPPLPVADQIDYPSYKVCRTITTNIFTGVLTFPSPDQCQKLEQIKTGLGYLLYLLTAMGIISELFKRVE
jgi:hypothetical protein